jgi:hypothetical protein
MANTHGQRPLAKPLKLLIPTCGERIELIRAMAVKQIIVAQGLTQSMSDCPQLGQRHRAGKRPIFAKKPTDRRIGKRKAARAPRARPVDDSPVARLSFVKTLGQLRESPSGRSAGRCFWNVRPSGIMWRTVKSGRRLRWNIWPTKKRTTLNRSGLIGGSNFGKAL